MAKPITIRCPNCRGEHTYDRDDLKPWPPKPGETRIVKCHYAAYIEHRAKNGNAAARHEKTWQATPLHLKIKF